MRFFNGRKKTVTNSVHDEYDYDREYEVEDNHSLPTDRAGITGSQFRTLFRLNVAAAVFQGASAAAIFGLIDGGDTAYPFYTNYPLPSGNEGKPIFGPDSKVAFNLSVGWLSGVFLALSAIDHLLVCTCFKSVYERGLSKKLQCISLDRVCTVCFLDEGPRWHSVGRYGSSYAISSVRVDGCDHAFRTGL
jgi:hypothetical protein